jgi:HEAT repeat protein
MATTQKEQLRAFGRRGQEGSLRRCRGGVTLGGAILAPGEGFNPGGPQMFPRFRMAALLCLIIISLSASWPARADEEPSFRGKTVTEWLEVLAKDSDAGLRKKAVIALERIGPVKSSRVLPAVTGAMSDEKQDPMVREAAAAALGRIYDANKPMIQEGNLKFDAALQALAASLTGDKAPGVREAAAGSLAQLGGDARGTVEWLTKALKDDHQEVRAAAAEALRRVATEKEAVKDVVAATPALQELLEDKDNTPPVRANAALALGQIGSPGASAAVPALAAAVAEAKAPTAVRKAAATALGRFGKDGAAGSSELAAALKDKEAPIELRRAAVEALDQFGVDAKPALAELKAAVEDKDVFLRVTAMHALGRLGPDLGEDAKGVVDLLAPRLTDGVVEVRLAAIQACGALGPDALGEDLRKVIGKLEFSAGDALPDVRAAATGALAKLKK